MIDVQWKDASDGRCRWAIFGDLRLVVQIKSLGGARWGVYMANGYPLEEDECDTIDEAIRQCELVATQNPGYTWPGLDKETK